MLNNFQFTILNFQSIFNFLILKHLNRKEEANKQSMFFKSDALKNGKN